MKTRTQLGWRPSPEVFNRVEWARNVTDSTVKEIVEACLSHSAVGKFVNKKVLEMAVEAKRATKALRTIPPPRHK